MDIVDFDDHLTHDQLMQKAMYEKDKGNEHFKKGNYAAAVDHYSRAMVLDPLQATLPCNRAMAYIKLRRYQEAIEDCDIALRLDPTYDKASYRRGLAHMALNDYNDAAEDFNAVLKVDPGNKSAIKELDSLKKMIASTTVGSLESRKTTIQTTDEEWSHVAVTSNSGNQSQSSKPLRRIPIEEVQSSQVNLKLLRRPTSPLGKRKHTPYTTDVSVDDQTLNCNQDTNGSPDTGDVVKGTSSPTMPSAPESSYQFLRDWQYLRQHKSSLSEYLLQIHPERFKDIFGDSLESDMFSSFIGAYANALSHRRDLTFKYSDALHWLSKVKRFDVMKLFMSSSDREALCLILKHIEDVNECDPDALKKLNGCYS